MARRRWGAATRAAATPYGVAVARLRATAALALLIVVLLNAAPARAAKPAVLIVSPQGLAGGWVDLTYLDELRRAGFEVDYTDGMADVTWERLQQYNALVIYACPPPRGTNAWPFSGSQPIDDAEFGALVNRYLAQGGGVLLMAVETQIGVTLVRNLITPWGADLPLETISDPATTAFMSHMPKVPLAHTTSIAPSPVSSGVRGIWYPIQPHYNGADTLPLAVDERWQVVVRAMPSARTVPVDLTKSSRPGPPNPLVRPGGVAAPPLFAIREIGAGRVALLSQWPVYSLGSGTKWLYNREVLSKGLNGKASDFGRLLQNSLRWLAEPSLRDDTLGGYVTAADRLEPPNLSDKVERQFAEPQWTGPDPRLLEPPRDAKLFKGLIGVQTALSGGQGTVAEYAAVAKQAGADFLVVLEDFANLDAAKLAQLRADCARSSDAALTVFPGYRIGTNIGNHLFLFGAGVQIPPVRLLTGPHKKTFALQGEVSPGVFGQTPPSAMEYLFGRTANTQIGYFDFAHSGMGMRLADARLYALVGLRSYRNGTLIEDLTADYLTTAQSTIVPAPAAVHVVTSPAALRSALQRNQGVTYAMARSRQHLWGDALLYTHQYACPNVFTSTGPLILRWPACVRVATLGAEPFVTGRSLMEAPLYVTADRGLKEIRIYDGQALYRRFILRGEKVFATVLFLEASVQRNLVLVAEDLAGGQAVSFARRSWKDGSLAPVFCSDRYNDCAYMFLARGPYPMTVLRTPELSDAGITWDGGPRGILTPLDFEGSAPFLDSDRGRINGAQYNQTPLLEFADEGAVAVRSERDDLIDERVRAVNPWNTYGPRAAAETMTFTLRYTQFDRPSVGVPPVGWAAPPMQAGCNAALFRGALHFNQRVGIKSLRLLRNWTWIPSLDLRLVVGRRQKVLHDIALPEMHTQRGTTGGPGLRFRLGRGHWFGFYSPETANSQMFINRGRPIELRIAEQQDGEWLSLWALQPRHAFPGDTYNYELFSIGCPLDVAALDAQAFADAARYLERPEGLRVNRGWRLSRRGPVELRAEDGAVQLAVPRPSTATNLTLPVIVNGLNRRWSVGLHQMQGYVKGHYGGGADRYRAVGLDLDGRAHVPLYPDLAARTEVEIGHPIVADRRGEDLFIQVTALSGGTTARPDYKWYVDVNNPLDHPVTTILTRNMDLPGFPFQTQSMTLAAGEHRVLVGAD
jgi:hypothetical protein